MSKENLEVVTKEDKKSKVVKFDYTQVDNETAKCMKDATEKIGMLREKTQKSLGELFSTVQRKLAGKNKYDGYFGKWYESMGFKKDFVYSCINYYELLVGNPENKKIQELSFSKGCEVAKLKDTPDLQQEVIELAPLKEMKVKLVEKLVKEVKERNEVTEDLINEICQNENTINLDKFITVTNSFIKDLKEQAETLSKENFEEVLKLIEEVKELCVIE